MYLENTSLDHKYCLLMVRYIYIHLIFPNTVHNAPSWGRHIYISFIEYTKLKLDLCL